MIDIEAKVYTPIAEALRERFAGISVSGIYENAPAQLPHASIVESDNYMTPAHLDSSDTEKYATVLYEVSTYSNKAGGKKSECREILAFIDEMMYKRNFVRTAMTPAPNIQDASIYRLVARYEAVTDGKTIYRKD